MSAADAIVLRSAGATARIVRQGAELTSWTVGGRELMWNADPLYWARSAPILFPVVGASAGGTVNIAGQSFAMPQHGFARDSLFDIVDHTDNVLILRLAASEATRKHYPFSFAFIVKYQLDGENLMAEFQIDNTGSGVMPYQLGFHPAFVWPFLADGKDGHELVFASDEPRPVHRPNAQGLLKRSSAASVARGRLPIASALFEQGALVFADAESRLVTFTSPSGARLTIAADGFPHWALWTKPGAPFVSIEQWTGLPEWEDFKGELAERPSVILAKQGDRRRHSIRLSVMLP